MTTTNEIQEHYKTCEECNGEGFLEFQEIDWINNIPSYYTEPCDKCEGLGEIEID